MDSIHAEFEELLRRGRTATQKDWLPLLVEVDAHLRSHFEAEDRWMAETDFPPRDSHFDEHAAVLKSSAEVLELARAGDFAAAPSFLASLADRFPGHAAYLDSALAAWDVQTAVRRPAGGPAPAPQGARRLTRAARRAAPLTPPAR